MGGKAVILLCGIFLLAVSCSSKSLGDNSSNSTSSRPVIIRRTALQPRTTRTEIKVSRSLNPDDMQTLNVRTKSGQVTQLIVKKRGGKSNDASSTAAPTSTTTEASTESSTVKEPSSTTELIANATEKEESKPFVASQPLFLTKSKPTKQKFAEGRKIRDDEILDEITQKISNYNKYYISQKTEDDSATVQAEYGNWSPVTKTTEEPPESVDNDESKDVSNYDGSSLNNFNSPVYITSASYSEGRSRPKTVDPDESSIVTKNDRNPVHIEVVSTKVNEENFKSASVPKPVYIRSDAMFIKGKPENIDFKRGKSIMKIGSDGIPEIHGVRMPDDESDEKIWRNARVINGELYPYPVGYKPKAAFPESQSDSQSDYSEKSFGPFTKDDNFPDNEDKGFGPFTTYDNLRNEEESDSIGPFSTSDNPTYSKKNLITPDYLHKGYGPFTKTDNSRVANSKLIEYIKQINDHEAKRDYFGKRNSRSEKDGEVKFPDQLQRRMLHNPGNQVYPPSQMYTPKAEALVAPVTFSEGVRNPVLQYAHPELGVQPAKTGNQYIQQRNSARANTQKSNKVIYYSDDLHSERSTYEPAMSTTAANYELTDDHITREKFRQNKYYDNLDYSFNRYNYYRPELSKHNNNYGYIRRVPEQTLWKRITDSMKDTFQSGIETVQQFTKPILEPIAKVTKPVLEPLMEASQKISHNLGFSDAPKSYYGHGYSAQDKVGTVAGAGSVLLPAIGLMAGGAALGLGAVAVGRFLDVDLMRSAGWSEEMIKKQLQMEHKRSLEAAHLNWIRAVEQHDPDKEYLMNQKDFTDNVQMPSKNVVYVIEAPNGNENLQVQSRRMKRSANNIDSDQKRIKRKESFFNDQDEEFDQKIDQNGQFADIEIYNAPESVPYDVLSNVRQIIDYSNAYEDSIKNEKITNQHSVYKRSLRGREDDFSEEDDVMEKLVQSVESDRTGQGLASDVLAHIHKTDWTNTPCAKKTFCEVMSAQPPDELFQMEKKMDSFLRVVHPSVANSVSTHLSDVMAAIRRHDCSEFKCRQT